MKKLDEIRTKCQEAVDEYKALRAEDKYTPYAVELGRAELAEEILEILNGEEK